ncbi:MAG: TetR/AcrR family transcriptional regulator [Sphingomonadaceae bacterium]
MNANPLESDRAIVNIRASRDATTKRGSGRRQAEKGAILRAQVLDAAIDCLSRMPYSEVTTSVIADRAGVSRGGMQYYFPTRLDLLQATVAHLHRLRLDLFRNDLMSMGGDVDAIDHVVESHWKHLNEREFRAYQELVLAARSEPGLSALLASSYPSFLAEWHNIARELLDWHAEDPDAGRRGNVAHYLLEGMAYGQLAGQLQQPEIREILEYAKSLLSSARSG